MTSWAFANAVGPKKPMKNCSCNLADGASSADDLMNSASTTSMAANGRAIVSSGHTGSPSTEEKPRKASFRSYASSATVQKEALLFGRAYKTLTSQSSLVQTWQNPIATTTSDLRKSWTTRPPSRDLIRQMPELDRIVLYTVLDHPWISEKGIDFLTKSRFELVDIDRAIKRLHALRLISVHYAPHRVYVPSAPFARSMRNEQN